MVNTNGIKLKHERVSSISFTRGPNNSLDDDEIQMSLAPYIDTYINQGRQDGSCGCFPIPFERAGPHSWFKPAFDSDVLEGQFRRSSFSQITLRFRYGLQYLIVSYISWIMYILVLKVFDECKYFEYIFPTLITVCLIFCIILKITYKNIYRQYMYGIAILVASLLVALLLILALINELTSNFTKVTFFAVVIRDICLIYTVVPLQLYVSCCICSFLTIFYELLMYIYHFDSEDYYTGLCVRVLCQICAHCIGLHILIMTTVRMRGTFMKVGQSLLVRKQLEMEKQLKDQMISSVMPPSVRDWLLNEENKEIYHRNSMPRPLNNNPNDYSSMFRPFNMRRMEKVSILFADIVGFTKMSSNKTAQEIVEILNDLFERFDQLCVDSGCEKISTLGDCYYCVSGCPDPREDHAKCCVQMGLGMIRAIREFDVEHKENVNMRVGVHTGTVLCGIVGSRRFKFDVWSNDVTLANKLESTGQPGRVHISQVTAQFLGGLYQLEEYESSLEDIKSFLIKHDEPEEVKISVNVCDSSPQRPRLLTSIALRKSHYLSLMTDVRKKASSLPCVFEKSEEMKTNSILNLFSNNSKSHSRFSFSKFKRKSSEKVTSESALTKDEEHDPIIRLEVPATTGEPFITSNEELFTNSRKDSGIRSNSRRSSIQHHLCLMNGVTSSELSQHRVSGYYTSSQSSLHDDCNDQKLSCNNLETCYNKLRKQSDLQLIRCVQNDSKNNYFVKVPINKFTLFFKEKEMEEEYRNNTHNIQEEDFQHAPTLATPRYNTYLDIVVSAFVLVFITISLYILNDVSAAFIVVSTLAILVHSIALLLSWIHLIRFTNSTLRSTKFIFSRWYPWHIFGGILVSLPSVLILLSYTQATSYDIYYSYLQIIGLLHFCNFTQLSCWMKSFIAILFGIIYFIIAVVREDHEKEVFLTFILILILILFLNREFEISYRSSYHGNVVSNRDKGHVQDMKNQADWLLHNIIPKYVADQLKTTAMYSENHKNVGIIFASVVNFNTLYEESFSGGKEYLRYLNELISDFDELLNDEKFKNVEKIKTIGSTFMAASGLNPQIRNNNSDPNEHLYELMEFALAMYKVIHNFNSDLFNFSLVLRVGYNIGDVTSGVIGRSKLFYDIWGDAVNVASRMDSTGVDHRIQVSQSCLHILQNRFSFEQRGSVYVKGKGNILVYLLKQTNGES